MGCSTVAWHLNTTSTDQLRQLASPFPHLYVWTLPACLLLFALHCIMHDCELSSLPWAVKAQALSLLSWCHLTSLCLSFPLCQPLVISILHSDWLLKNVHLWESMQCLTLCVWCASPDKMTSSYMLARVRIPCFPYGRITPRAHGARCSNSLVDAQVGFRSWLLWIAPQRK